MSLGASAIADPTTFAQERGRDRESRPSSSRLDRGSPPSPHDVAEGAKDEPVLGPVAGGDADELAGFEALLVVAGAGVDAAADEQAADQVLGGQAVAGARPGRSWRASGRRAGPRILARAAKNRRELRMKRMRFALVLAPGSRGGSRGRRSTRPGPTSSTGSRCPAASGPARGPSPRSRPGCRRRRSPWTCSSRPSGSGTARPRPPRSGSA